MSAAVYSQRLRAALAVDAAAADLGGAWVLFFFDGLEIRGYQKV